MHTKRSQREVLKAIRLSKNIERIIFISTAIWLIPALVWRGFNFDCASFLMSPTPTVRNPSLTLTQLCSLEGHDILRSLWDITIAPPWQCEFCSANTIVQIHLLITCLYWSAFRKYKSVDHCQYNVNNAKITENNGAGRYSKLSEFRKDNSSAFTGTCSATGYCHTG